MKRSFLFKLLALFTAVCLCGCAQRKIYFDSNPAGAAVSYDSRHCITPCTLKANCDAGKALLSHPIEGDVVAEVKACAIGDTARYHSLRATEMTFKGAAVPFFGITLLCLGTIREDLDSGDSVDPDLLWVAAGGFIAAGIFYNIGELFGKMKGDLDTEVRVTFPPRDTPSTAVLTEGTNAPGPIYPQTKLGEPTKNPSANLQLNTEAYHRLFAEPQAEQNAD